MNLSATTDAVPPPTGGRSLFIAGLGIGQICSWGSLYYSFPMVVEAMSGDLGWSKGQLYGGATIGLALSGLAAYPVGSAIDRGHGRIVMASGSVLAGLLLALWSQVNSLWLFYAVIAGLGIAQAATLYDPAFAVIARRTGPMAARAGITALTLWGGFSSTVFIPLIQFLLDHIGWRDTLLVLGAINIVLCAGLNAAIIDPSADPVRAPDPLRAPLPSTSKIGLSELTPRAAVRWAFRQPVFWALALTFTAYAATFSAFTFHFYPLLIERGFDTSTVVVALAILGPSQVAGRVAILMLAPRASVRVIGCITVLAFPLAMISLETLPANFLVIAGIVMFYGAANGIITIVRGLAVPEMLTRHAYGAINGALAAPATLARATAPVGAALLWQATGSYDAVLLWLFVGALALVVGFWFAAFLSRHHHAH